MFSRTLVRSLPPCLCRPIPRAIPRSQSQLQRLPPSRLTALSKCHYSRQYTHRPSHVPRVESPPHSRSFFHTTPQQRSRRSRFDPDAARKARPLLTPEQIYNHFFRNRTYQVGVVILAGGLTFFYWWNLEYVPVTGRRRFNCFSEDKMLGDAEFMYRQIMQEFSGSILPVWDRRSRMVTRVMDRLIPVSGLEKASWEVHVIYSDEKNAFVIPGGKVFVFSGILDIAQTDDGLAAILGHEIAHTLARHQAESMSKTIWLIPMRFVLEVVLATMGDTMGLGRMISNLFAEFGVMMPASRRQELEADYIGLLMMAKGCYDPEAAVGVWERMEEATKGTANDIPQILSTHPSNANRIKKMVEWLPKAESMREDSGCSTSLAYVRDFKRAAGNFSPWDWL